MVNCCVEVDVLLFMWGGGLLEDLWCFNDESLVREVVVSVFFIVSVVGYEVDFIISDFVVDVCVFILFVVVEILS